MDGYPVPLGLRELTHPWNLMDESRLARSLRESVASVQSVRTAVQALGEFARYRESTRRHGDEDFELLPKVWRENRLSSAHFAYDLWLGEAMSTYAEATWTGIREAVVGWHRVGRLDVSWAEPPEEVLAALAGFWLDRAVSRSMRHAIHWLDRALTNAHADLTREFCQVLSGHRGRVWEGIDLPVVVAAVRHCGAGAVDVLSRFESDASSAETLRELAGTYLRLLEEGEDLSDIR